jgi:anti-sigma B factor antagonist
VSEERDIAVVVLEGEVDLSTAPEAERRIAEAEQGGPAQIVVDLREVTFMDSSGLRVLLTAHRRARDEERDFAIVKGSDAVARLFDVTGLTDRLVLLDEVPTGAVT